MTTLIQFKDLKEFPAIELGNKVEITEFLEASAMVTKVIGSLGKIFSPIVNDMQGNIVKLQNIYEKDIEKFEYLENLLIDNLNPDIDFTADALLWLKRALQLIYIFFNNILNDDKLDENLKNHLQDAYNNSLKPYHSWVIQNTITFIYRWVPKRSELLGKGYDYDENIKILSNFLPNLRSNIERIDLLLSKINYDSNSNKV